MNAFDAGILHFLNQFAGKSWLLDKAVGFIRGSTLHGPIFMAAMWWAWFRPGENQRRDREFILSGLATTFGALFFARALADLLPFRARPFEVASLNLRLPFGGDSASLIHWSSFPSDHAVFYFSLATSIFFVSRRLGVAAYLYTFLFICMPILYRGQHYPTDVLAGTAIGIGAAFLSVNAKLREWIAQRPLRRLENSPGIIYAVFFLVSFLFSMQFDPLRDTAYSAWSTARYLIHGQH